MKLKTKYLPISVKRQICETIVNNSIIERDGLKFIDSIQKQFAFDLSLLQFYSDIDIEGLDLDKLYEDGTIDTIKNLIPTSEIQFIEIHTNYMLKQETEIYNSLSAVVNRNLQKLIEKIPDEASMKSIIKDIPKMINKIKPENLEVIKSLGKVN